MFRGPQVKPGNVDFNAKTRLTANMAANSLSLKEVKHPEAITVLTALGRPGLSVQVPVRSNGQTAAWFL